MVDKHIIPDNNFDFPQTLHKDSHRLEIVDVPIVTVSASFKKEIEEQTGEKTKVKDEVILSRAHYSMAIALLEEARNQKKKVLLIDPINYIANKDWKTVVQIEYIGQLAARIPIIKNIKNLLEKVIRSKLPIADKIEKPLLYATEFLEKPIISVHYETGNILARNHKKVLQIVTDPHVRSNYLLEAERKNISFAVFDNETKREFLEKASKMGKKVAERKIVVTGPPVDPRIVAAAKGKNNNNFKKRGLRLVIATSGLGSNKDEIEKITENLFQIQAQTKIELLFYAATHKDFEEMFSFLAKKYNLKIGKTSENTKVRIIFQQSIVDANEDLIKYGFPWADGFITKPSGDMAYDAVAAGCFLLTLNPWGEWEENIEKIFFSLKIAQKAKVDDLSGQVDELISSKWIENAINNALNIDEIFLHGAKNIIDLQQKLAKEKS